MRPLALGRKNWIHLGSALAGPRIAAILSVVETCRLDLPCAPIWPRYCPASTAALAPLSPLSRPSPGPPPADLGSLDGCSFSGGAKLPSAKVSSQFRSARRSSVERSSRQAAIQIPASSQTFRRRQQLTPLGCRGGLSFQRAPERKIQKSPLQTGSITGPRVAPSVMPNQERRQRGLDFGPLFVGKLAFSAQGFAAESPVQDQSPRQTSHQARPFPAPYLFMKPLLV